VQPTTRTTRRRTPDSVLSVSAFSTNGELMKLRHNPLSWITVPGLVVLPLSFRSTRLSARFVFFLRSRRLIEVSDELSIIAMMPLLYIYVWRSQVL